MFSRDEFIYVGRVAASRDDSRYRLASFVADRRAILDVGCAVGYIGEFLRRSGPDHWLAGIEIDPGAAEQARAYYDQVVVGSIDDEAVWAQLQRPVDAMIFGDVLEHTADPIQVLRLASGRLADGGMIVISMPNIAHFRVRMRLLSGRFDYEDWGIMDRTHLRFFTLKTAKAMLSQAGFRVVHTEGVHGYPIPATLPPAAQAWRRMKSRARAFLTQRRPTLFATQFIFVAVRAQPAVAPSAAQPASASRAG